MSTRTRDYRISLIIAGLACVTLASCQMGLGGGGGGAGTEEAPATSARLVDRDVEAPEIFQTEDKALWDGRPSLGGVWVASPAAKDPERVILRNPANGKFVIGGLFRREADLPGPKLQLSSDAAEALGLLAGEPATISVTALRRDEAGVDTDAAAPLVDTAAAVPAEDMAVETLPAAGTPPSADGVAAEAMAAIAPPPRPEAKPEAEPVAAAPAAGGSLIQIGIFSQEANAKRAVSILESVGISAKMTKETSQGKDLWSVTTRGDAAAVEKVKAAGFADAYILKR